MAPTFHHHIDQPSAWDRLRRCFLVRGWCFGEAEVALTGIRCRTDSGLTFAGAVNLPRPDVKAALPGAPCDNTGFEIRGTLPTGSIAIYIEAQTADGRWHLLTMKQVHVAGSLLPRWLGGGSVTELIAFQMPAHAAHPPRPVAPEKFPRRRSTRPPKISVVTPSFNQARFLSETMSRVLDQANVACDYVVQDGGSTDGSAVLIASHASRLKAWASERDQGQADAIAKGFTKASGKPDDIMAWINSDDFYLPGALGFVADYFARHPEVDVIYGHRVLVDENSQEIGRWYLPKHDAEVLRLNDFVPQETMFWRRRVWNKVGGIDPAFKFAMDWDLLLRFQAAGAKIVRVPYFLACFRIHSAQKTSAQMHSVGQQEIDRLRERTFGRSLPPTELESHPALLRYLRRSAFIEFLWKLGLRVP